MFKAYSFSMDETAEAYVKANAPNRYKEDLDLLSRKSTLQDAFSSLDSLNSKVIQDAWFTKVDADVFISHSSTDDEQAKTLGAYLQQHFGLKVFIDSLMWHHVDKMLKSLDEKYCVLCDGSDGQGKTYSYENRNITTAHAHILLAHALIKMIDATECFIYLNTENSTIRKAGDNLTTHSPWLYHELAVVDSIREMDRKGRRLVKEGFAMDSFSAKIPDFDYEAPTKRLLGLTIDHLKKWRDMIGERRGGEALKILYQII